MRRLKLSRRGLIALLVVCLLITSVFGLGAFSSGSKAAADLAVYINTDQCNTADGGSLSVPVMSNGTATDGVLTLSYDPTVLSVTVDNVETTQQVVKYAANVVEEGTLMISFITDKQEVGPLFNVTFDVKKQGAKTGLSLSGEAFAGNPGEAELSRNVGNLGDETPSGHDCPSKQFKDLDLTRWYHDGVDYAVANGLMNGVSDTAFAPNNNLNRGMLATILYRAAGSPKVSGSSDFTDVPAGKYYTKAVTWAAANGIVNGKTKTTFAPGEDVTREQLATMLWRYAKLTGGDLSADSSALSGFTDKDQVSNYAGEAMTWAVSKGIINGRNATTLAPKGNASRAEVATMVYRFLTLS